MCWVVGFGNAERASERGEGARATGASDSSGAGASRRSPSYVGVGSSTMNFAILNLIATKVQELDLGTNKVFSY